MKNYLCWRPDTVYHIINSDAEAVLDEVFLAVHTDYPLLVSDQAGNLMSVAPRTFLFENFLDPARGDYVQAIILGESGVGKSHFIQWMRLNLPERSDTEVLVIPKSRTSLRSIVGRIVELLPDHLAAPYRKELGQVFGLALDEAGQADRFLSSLSLAISQDPVREIADPELEVALIEALPALFQDPYLRKVRFTPHTGIVAELTAHIFTERSANSRAEDRREFTADDIDFSGRQYADAATPTRDAIDLIGDRDSETFGLALRIINRNLDTALAFALSFTPQRFVDMMTDLRQHLRRQNRKLIILVEDLALLQGIDNALLLALTTPGRQGVEELCELRWAAAVTTGYFGRLHASVRTRMTFRVEMDRPGAESRKLIGREGLVTFAARYLNAVRLGPERLAIWHEQRGGAKPDSGEVQNACVDCVHRLECHAAFGADGDTGLYPFNSEALWTMARRADSNFDSTFRPREFLTAVLRRIMYTHAESLAAGAFPPSTLVEELADQNLFPAILRQRLIDRDPVDHARRRALLEFWLGRAEIVNLHPGIHAAFDLPLLTGAGAAEGGTELGSGEDENEDGEGNGKGASGLIDTKPAVRMAEDPDARVIEMWARGGPMRETQANKLRVGLYETLIDYIDWDGLAIDRPSVAGASGGAKSLVPVSFKFHRQETASTPTRISLTLPLEESESAYNTSAIALAGLLRFRKLRHWNFNNGPEALARLSECLKIWSMEIVRQIREQIAPAPAWNPAAAAVELLAVGRLLTGAKNDEAVLLDAVLLKTPLAAPPMMDEALGKLVSAIERDRNNLRRAVHGTSAGTKGGQAGGFVDPTPILDALGALRRSKWRLTQIPPDVAGGPFSGVAKVYRNVASALDQAVAAEVKARRAWLESISPHVETGQTGKELKEAVVTAREAMIRAGLPGTNSAFFDSAMERFEPTNFVTAMSSVAALAEGLTPNEILPRLLPSRQATMTGATEFIRRADEMIRNGEVGLTARRTELQARIQPVEQVKADISILLAKLHDALGKLP